jgi:hypothetical protein
VSCRQLIWTFRHSCSLAACPGPRSFLALVPLDLAVPVLETGSVAAFEWPCWWQAVASTCQKQLVQRAASGRWTG